MTILHVNDDASQLLAAVSRCAEVNFNTIAAQARLATKDDAVRPTGMALQADAATLPDNRKCAVSLDARSMSLQVEQRIMSTPNLERGSGEILDVLRHDAMVTSFNGRCRELPCDFLSQDDEQILANL